MGTWTLKPKKYIDPYKALCVDQDDILDFVNLDLVDGYEISEMDREHIFNYVRDGYYAGEVNDCDEGNRASEQQI